jgi:hypothetical protein
MPKICLSHDGCYVEVVINDVFLADTRTWFKDYNPMVFAILDYDYGTSRHTDTSIVCTSKLPNGLGKSAGVTFSNKTVWDPHPFRGNTLDFGIVLCKISIRNYAEEVLNLVESTASTLQAGLAVGNYIQVARVKSPLNTYNCIP